MAAKTFFLTIQNGPEANRRVEITGRSFLIGRDTSADLVVDDIEVSRRHVRLIAQSGGYVIEDMGSTNGTYLNDERLTSMLPLTAGADIRLGDNIALRFSVVDHDEADTDPVVPARSESPPRQAPVPPTPSRPEPVREPLPPAIPAPQPQAPTPIAETPAGEPPRREARARRRLPTFKSPWVVGCGVLLLLGILAGIAFLWYVDANFLWCDVFGGLIPACR